MYEFFEHTADLGLRVRSPRLETLFAEAAEGLFSMIVEGIPPDPSDREVALALASPRRDWLFFDWLSELLYRFEVEHELGYDFRVRLTPEGLDARLRVQPLDPERHRLVREVKAITYHGLRVEPTEGGWEAEVIVDI